MRFGDLTYEEIRNHAADGWMAIVPTGCTEQQGPHLPVDFDTWFAETVCMTASKTAAEKFGTPSLVLPAMPFGPTPEHRNFGSGYIDVPARLQEALLYHVLRSLRDQGFRSIIVWRGCGQHDLKETVQRCNAESGDQCRVFLPELPYHDIWMKRGDPSLPGGHADSFSTSLALYLRPEAVHLDRISNPMSAAVDWDDPDLDFSQYSTNGVIGDPTGASAALGEELWNGVVEEVAGLFAEFAGSHHS